jgi:hypothetical protein
MKSLIIFHESKNVKNVPYSYCKCSGQVHLRGQLRRPGVLLVLRWPCLHDCEVPAVTGMRLENVSEKCQDIGYLKAYLCQEIGYLPCLYK